MLVLDNAEGAGTAVMMLHVVDLDTAVTRLRGPGVDVPDPAKVEGFDTLGYVQVADPAGNEVSLLEGS